MEKKNHNAGDLTKVLSIFFCIVLVIITFFNQQKKRNLSEAKLLPFYNVSLESVQNGTYENRTVTSFMTLQLQVTVAEHQITKINIVENKGTRGQKAEKIIERMIEKNKAVISLVDGDEIGSLVFISCVDGALKQGVPEDIR